LGSCGDTEVKAQAVPKAVISDKITEEAHEASKNLDASQLSISELQSEIKKIEARIGELEAEGASRKDIYLLRKKIFVLEEAETAAEEAQTAADMERGKKIDEITDRLKEE